MVGKLEVLECEWCGKFFHFFQVSQIFKNAYTYYYCPDCNNFICPKCLVGANSTTMNSVGMKIEKKGILKKKIESTEQISQRFFCKACHNAILRLDDPNTLRKLKKEKEETAIKELVSSSMKRMKAEKGKISCPYCGEPSTGGCDYCKCCGAYIVS